MKNPLHYQLSEYDCGPTALLNGISFLFEREEIPPEILRNIMLYCLDCYGSEGSPGKSGTSCTAMMFLSHWLDGFGQTGKLSVSSQYLTGKRVVLQKDSMIYDALHRGGAAVVRLYYDVAHYVLLTGERDDRIFMFDPYYQTNPFPQKDITITLEHPFTYNRIVPMEYLNREDHGIYAMGESDHREAVLLFNEKTKLTPERTIEYMI